MMASGLQEQLTYLPERTPPLRGRGLSRRAIFVTQIESRGDATFREPAASLIVYVVERPGPIRYPVMSFAAVAANASEHLG